MAERQDDRHRHGLTTGSYTLAAAAGYTDNRLTLQIGGVRPDGTISHDEPATANWTVRGSNGYLMVSGINAGDLVSIHALSGALMESYRSSGDSYTSHQLPQGVYVVTVNRSSKKIRL